VRSTVRTAPDRSMTWPSCSAVGTTTRDTIPYSSPASSPPSTNAWPRYGSHVTSPRSPAVICSGVCTSGSACASWRPSRIRNVNGSVVVSGGGAYLCGWGRGPVGTVTVWPSFDPSGSLLRQSSPSNSSSVEVRQYCGSEVTTSNRSRTGASSVSCAWIEMNGSRPAPSSPAVEKSTSGSERNPGSRPGTSTAAAITANATGLEPRTDVPRRRVLEPDHTGPHWRTRRTPSANTTASAAASSTIA
jgi:hypothetical protein